MQPAGSVSSDFIDMIVCPWQSNSHQDMAGWCQENIKVMGKGFCGGVLGSGSFGEARGVWLPDMEPQ
jgi:hypothetical protein